MAKDGREYHAKLLRLYGGRDEKCGNCAHLRTHSYARDYFKCSKAAVTGGPSTDWRKSWQACGKFEPQTED